MTHLKPRAPAIGIGSSVRLRASGKVGIVVAEVGRTKVRVQIGNITIICQIEGLESCPITTTKMPPDRKGKERQTNVAPASRRALQSLDLHGKTVAEALECLETHLSRAVMAGINEVAVVHGIGTGKVCAAVRARLKKLDVVRRIDIVDSNPGLTRVWLG